jgi:Flp pilus assembly protein TadG
MSRVATTSVARGASRGTSRPNSLGLRLGLRRSRRGAVAAETVVAASLVVLLLCAIIVGGMGVFRSHQVDCLSRAAARYLAVHGSSWAKDSGQSSPATQDVLNNVVKPLAVGMDASTLSLQVDWINELKDNSTDWNSAGHAPYGTTSTGDTVANAVRATVVYQWTPPMYWGTMTFRSVTLIPMSY